MVVLSSLINVVYVLKRNKFRPLDIDPLDYSICVFLPCSYKRQFTHSSYHSLHARFESHVKLIDVNWFFDLYASLKNYLDIFWVI